ncbi:MAG: (2Fe-2S)-binding protein [Terriglobales bacterium]
MPEVGTAELASAMRIVVKITVNGQPYSREIEPRTLLVEFLREACDLTGTHVGCDTSYCGACTVLMNSLAVKSCTVLAVQADGTEIVTVEGLEKDGQLGAIQKAFGESYGLQCGYCTPGLMLATRQLLSENPEPSEKEIRKAIAGNTCRCTGYMNIFKAVRLAGRNMKGACGD